MCKDFYYYYFFFRKMNERQWRQSHQKTVQVWSQVKARQGRSGGRSQPHSLGEVWRGCWGVPESKSAVRGVLGHPGWVCVSQSWAGSGRGDMASRGKQWWESREQQPALSSRSASVSSRPSLAVSHEPQEEAVNLRLRCKVCYQKHFHLSTKMFQNP